MLIVPDQAVQTARLWRFLMLGERPVSGVDAEAYRLGQEGNRRTPAAVAKPLNCIELVLPISPSLTLFKDSR